MYTDKENGIPPGTYTYTYEVTTCGNVSQQMIVEVTLEDPCVGAIVDSKPISDEFVYTITDSGNEIPLTP